MLRAAIRRRGMTMTSRPRAAIYARFSTDMQNERSAEDQARVCRERADREGWDIVEVFSDLAISGTTNRRPGLNAMLAAAAAGEFEIIIAEALDRISRNQADSATIFQRLEFSGVKLFTISEDRVSELHIGLLGTMNALYVKELANKIRRGQKGVVSRGRVPGGLCYGYDVVPTLRPDGTLDRGLRKINEDQATVVRRIYREFLNGRSPKNIAQQLNAEGIPSARGGEWRVSSIIGNRARMIGILHNPIYSGRLAYNRVRMVKDPDTRKRISRINAAADITWADHPELRIVDEKMWQAVQHWRESNSATPARNQTRPKSLLAGLIKCGQCGGSYVIHSRTYMACASANSGGRCTNTRRFRREDIEERVLGGLRDNLLAPDIVKAVVAEYHVHMERIHRRDAESQIKIQRDYNRAKAAVGRLVAAIADGGADFAEVKAALSAKKAEMTAAEKALSEIDAVPVIALHPQVAEQYRKRVLALIETLNSGEETRETAMAGIRNILERVEIHASPERRGPWHIEIVNSLASTLQLASGRKMPFRNVTVEVVAEEGYHFGSQLRRFRA